LRFFLLLAVLYITGAAQARARPVVVELFTSEACSSCPPAEALLRTLKASDPAILPLSLHVTYWDGPAWSDRYALTQATERQGWYAGLQNSDNVYTPEAVIDGRAQVIGSRRGAVTGAIADARAGQPPAIPITLGLTGNGLLAITVGAGATAPAKLWLFGFDPAHTTHIGGGENSGATVNEVNVVRSITPLGTWTGVAVTYKMPTPAGAEVAVLLQADDGHILGAASN
jgi:hypothetical protein